MQLMTNLNPQVQFITTTDLQLTVLTQFLAKTISIHMSNQIIMDTKIQHQVLLYKLNWSALFGSKLSGDIGVITKPEQTPEQPSTPSSGEITIESENGGNFDILTGLNGASILTGGVSGLKEDMVIAGQAGSYTIDQNGKNAFTLTIDADDTVGDVINKINASGMYKAYLDKDGKLVIATASAPSQSTPGGSI